MNIIVWRKIGQFCWWALLWKTATALEENSCRNQRWIASMMWKIETYVYSDGEILQKLTDIHNNPKKYAVLWLRQFWGNLGSRGYFPAEQNHSRAKAYLGQGCTLTPIENVKKIDRHNKHSKKKSAFFNLMRLTSNCYKSPLRGWCKDADIKDKRIISPRVTRNIRLLFGFQYISNLMLTITVLLNATPLLLPIHFIFSIGN